MSVLKAENLVDDETLNAIHLQFEHILRHKELKPHAPREIDASYVFHELISQGRIAQRPLAMRQGTSRDGVDFVNRIALDGGFAEWRHCFWLPSVRGLSAARKRPSLLSRFERQTDKLKLKLKPGALRNPLDFLDKLWRKDGGSGGGGPLV